MMEMVEERQELSENEIHTRVERILQIVQENMSTPVIQVYKEKLNATLDLKALREMVEAIDPAIPTGDLDVNALIDQLDLNAWLSLILGRWGLFEPILKNTGRSGIQILKDVYSQYANDVQINSIRDARNVALSAHELLTEFHCKDGAVKVGILRDELLGLASHSDYRSLPAPHEDETPEIPTMPAIHNKWLGVHDVKDKAAKPDGEVQDDKGNAVRIDRKRTKLIKPPSDLTFLKLEIVGKDGSASAQTIDIKKPSLIIGRSQMADVEVTDPLVSRIHLMITGTTPIDIKVTDLNSSNGTCLDGVPLKPNEPAYWDVGKPIVIGDTWMILRQTT